MSLRWTALTGLSWSALSEIVVGLLQVLQLVVLARLLAPESFGLFAIVLAVTSILGIFSDFGINDAIVQREAPTNDQLSSLYWLSVGIGFALFTLVLVLAQSLETVFSEDRLATLLILGAAPIAISPFGHQFSLLLQKELKFRTLNVIEILVGVLTTCLSILLALYGAGVFALLWAQIGGTVASVVALNFVGRKSWRPRLHFARSDLKEYLNFGLYIMAQRVVETISSQLDKLLLGALIGTNALGSYYLAQRMSDMPLLRFNAISLRVLFPIYTRRQSDIAALRYGYLATVRGMATIGFPICLGIAVTAPLLVPIVLGEGWEETILFLQILAVGNIFNFVNIPGHALVLARGKARLKLFWSIVFSAMRIPMVTFGIIVGGVTGLVWAVATFRALSVLPYYRLMIRSQLGPCAGAIISQITPALLISVAMAALVAGFIAALAQADLTGLIGSVALGVAVQAVLMAIFQSDYIRLLRQIIFNRERSN